MPPRARLPLRSAWCVKTLVGNAVLKAMRLVLVVLTPEPKSTQRYSAFNEQWFPLPIFNSTPPPPCQPVNSPAVLANSCAVIDGGGGYVSMNFASYLTLVMARRPAP